MGEIEGELEGDCEGVWEGRSLGADVGREEGICMGRGKGGRNMPLSFAEDKIGNINECVMCER